MTGRRFVITSLLATALIALALAMAELLDAPGLRLATLPLLVILFGAREAWHWRGAGRLWLVVHGSLVGGVIAIGFVAQRLAG